MRSTRWVWPLSLVIAIVAGVALLFARPPQADAHAVLERSNPSQNQQFQLDEAPDLVETWYSESLERSLTKLRVLNAQSQPVQTGETVFSDSEPKYAAVALPADLPPGIYTVAFENVSTVDGHQWTGSFSFIVLNADGSRPAGTAVSVGESGQGFLPEIGDSTLRWIALLAAVTMVGATSFYLFIARPAADFLSPDEARGVRSAATALAADLMVMAAPLLVVSVLGQIFLLADRLGGSEALDNILFDTRTGELWLSRLGLSLALLLLFVPALRSERFRSDSRVDLFVWLALIGSLGLLMTFSLGSHGAAGGGSFWSVASDFVHFAATGAWIGALLQLPLIFWWTRGRLDGAKRVLYQANMLDRFSWLAVVSVVLLLGTGVFNGFVELPTLESLWDTTYGRVLIVKLALIVPLLAVAAINAFVLKPALVDTADALYDESPEYTPTEAQRSRLAARLERLQRAMPRTVVAEFLLGVAVLASVAVLAQSTTAEGELRQAAGKPSGQFTQRQETGDLTVDLKVQPFGIGLTTYTISLAPKGSGELGDVLDVRLTARYDNPAAPQAGTSGTQQELTKTADAAVWTAEAALLTQPGNWRVETRVRRRSLDDENVTFDVRRVGGILADMNEPKDLFDLPFTFVDWNIVAGGAMVALGVGVFLIWRNRPPTWQQSTSASIGLASATAIGAGIVLLVGVHVHDDAIGPNPVPRTAESVAIGQRLFEDNCTTCHGADGKGLSGRAADLTVHVPGHGDTTLFIWVTDGVNGSIGQMPSFKDQFTDKERWDLVNYLRNRFDTGDVDIVLPTDLAAGS